MNKRLQVVGAAVLALFGGGAQALTNGDFENGLDGWSTLGDASVQGGAPQGRGQLWLTTASNDYVDDLPLAAGALNRSGTSAVAVGTVNAGPAALTGLFQGGTLDPDPVHGLYAYEGSAAGQQFTANAGDTVHFSWNFGTRDTYADYGFAVIDGKLIRLGDAASAGQIGTLGNDRQTGYSDYAYTLLGNGMHQLIFGVVDVGDFSQTSTLAIDSVRISAAVPEPQAWVLAGIGLLSGWIARRRTPSS